MLPFIHIFGRAVPMYGLCLAAAVLLCGGLALRRAKRRGFDGNCLLVIMACALGVGLLGAKVQYIVSSYGLDAAWASLGRGDLSFLTDGGLVFYGGLIGGVAGAIVSCLLLKEDLAALCGVAVPLLPLGHAIGRVGCYCAGCCYGVAYSGPLAARSPFLPAGATAFPVQLVEAALNLALWGCLLLYTKKLRDSLRPLYLYLALYAVERFFLEYLRADAIRGALGPLSTSQAIAAGLLCLSLALLWHTRTKNTSPD